ncbi:uncharacterized protein LOC116287459 [Actinia tenebrosa]|uniref:Uncharacterized protein LOC116287459 n=1 Tax=Actinia tenebrosa TaxID=6105 RepID=A0A6P8H0N8_ACTTE|nr:uncharacterized protein LOC116287459 [Actinia tenebrosa]
MQLLDGMNSIGNFGDIMAHKSVFDTVLENKQKKLTASKSLFKVDYAEKGSNMRNKEDSTMYCFEVFLVDLEEGEADGVALEDLFIFITVVESPPSLGFDLPITIQFYDFVGKERRRPSSSTCCLTLDLPRGMEDPEKIKSLMRDSIL